MKEPTEAQKVEELVEWATRRLAHKYHQPLSYCRKYVKEILTNPEYPLALIDREEKFCTMCKGKGIYPANVAEDRKCPKCDGKKVVEFKILIPLSEYLEVKK